MFSAWYHIGHPRSFQIYTFPTFFQVAVKVLLNLHTRPVRRQPNVQEKLNNKSNFLVMKSLLPAFLHPSPVLWNKITTALQQSRFLQQCCLLTKFSTFLVKHIYTMACGCKVETHVRPFLTSATESSLLYSLFWMIWESPKRQNKTSRARRKFEIKFIKLFSTPNLLM
jgi:hypothetical protein